MCGIQVLIHAVRIAYLLYGLRETLQFHTKSTKWTQIIVRESLRNRNAHICRSWTAVFRFERSSLKLVLFSVVGMFLKVDYILSLIWSHARVCVCGLIVKYNIQICRIRSNWSECVGIGFFGIAKYTLYSFSLRSFKDNSTKLIFFSILIFFCWHSKKDLIRMIVWISQIYNLQTVSTNRIHHAVGIMEWCA